MDNTPKTAKQVKDSVDQYNSFQTNFAKPDDIALSANINHWKSMTGDPFMLMNVWLTKILDAGSIWDNNYNQKGFQQPNDASYLTRAGDQISDVSLQMNFTAAYSSPLTTDIQDQYNASGNINQILGNLPTSGPYTGDKTSTGISLMLGWVNDPKVAQQFFGGVGSSSQNGVLTALTSLANDFNQIKTSPNWGGSLSTFLSDVSDKNDTTGAASINNDITQQMSNLGQSIQTINGTLQEQLQFNVGTQEQWQSLAQTLMKTFMSIWQTFTGNQKSS